MFLIAATLISKSMTDSIVIDSRITREVALRGSRAPSAIIASQSLIRVYYYGFDQRLHEGQLVVDRALKSEILSIFLELREIRFPIARIRPVSVYAWNDRRSMMKNNTSGFNFRTIAGGRTLSDHAYGRAIDLNPFQNPDERIKLNGSTYNPATPGTITRQSAPYKAFIKRGWKWGGDWQGKKDYQHFYKR